MSTYCLGMGKRRFVPFMSLSVAVTFSYFDCHLARRVILELNLDAH